MNMKMIHMITLLLTIVGAINWGLTALGLNVVNMLVGGWPALETSVYLLVGVSGVYVLLMHPKECKVCSGKSGKK